MNAKANKSEKFKPSTHRKVAMKNISTIKDDSTLVILEDIKREITITLGEKVKEIVLYGSYARNEQNMDSDIDIVVFLDNAVTNKAEIRKKLTDIKVDLSLKYDVVVSILLKDYRQYMDYRDIVPFYSHIYNEGVALYG